MSNKAIVYTVDDNADCLFQLVMSLKSVRRMAPEKFDVFILTNRPRPWMENLYGARVVDVSGMVEEYGLDNTGITWRKNPVPPMLLFRLLLPLVKELQPYDQVLYLDTDTEVWNSKFFDIFSKDLACDVIGVRDSLSDKGVTRRLSTIRERGGPGWKDPPGVFNRWDELIAGRGKYVNSGVLVFNMPILRNGYERRARHMMDRVKVLQPYYSDQDTINVYLRAYSVDDRRYNAWGIHVPGAFLRHYVGGDRRKSPEYPRISDLRPYAALDGRKGAADRIYVLADDSRSENMERLSKWLEVNGMRDFAKISTRDTGKYAGLLDRLPHDHVRPEHMENWMGHYKAVVDALESGCERIMVLEDTFDPDGLAGRDLNNLRADYDIALLIGHGNLRRVSRFGAASSKGYMLGVKGMVALRRLFESLWYPDIPGHRLRYVHKWLSDKVMPGMRAYART